MNEEKCYFSKAHNFSISYSLCFVANVLVLHVILVLARFDIVSRIGSKYSCKYELM